MLYSTMVARVLRRKRLNNKIYLLLSLSIQIGGITMKDQLIKNDLHYGYVSSPIGLLEICAYADAIKSIYFAGDQVYEETTSPIIEQAKLQLEEYFEGKRKEFDLKLALSGTEFQLRVWNELIKIPYGQTVSYGEIAKRIGNPKASRAVGGANNKNPISIVVPCHRVIGANKKMVGYGGGLWRKEKLLKIESE